MKRFFQIIGRISTVFLVVLMMSIIAFAATASTSWPNHPPTGEVPGGVLKTYFQNLLGRCDGNKVLVAINKATGIKECANANSLISVANFGLCPATNSYPKLDFTFGSSPVSSKIRLIWSSENTTQCSISGISTTATGGSIDVPANGSSYTLSCSGTDGSTVSQTMNTASIGAIGGGIVWPTMNPGGESTGGIFGNYLSNLGGEIGKCSSNEVIVGFEANGKPKCVVASSLMSAGSCPGSSDPYINFTATPSNIAPGDPVTLAWQAGNLTSCTTSDAFAVNGSASGSALINPTTTSTYRITCSDDAGRQMQKSVSVTVTPPPIPGGWSSFGACQTSCTKTRTCTNPTPQNGGLTCQNDAQGGATVSCNDGQCSFIDPRCFTYSFVDYISPTDGRSSYWINKSSSTIGVHIDSAPQNQYGNLLCGASSITLRFPSLVEGYPIVSIGDDAFSDLLGFDSIILPSSLVWIGKEAFRGAHLSGDLVIPDSVKYIGTKAFAANYFSGVTIGTNVQLIDERAFSSSFNISLIIRPSLVPLTIRQYAFKLNNIKSVDQVLLSRPSITLSDGAFMANNISSLNIPDNIYTIPKYTFYGNGLESLSLGNNIRYIGESAFSNNSLTGVVIPNGVESIGNGAFYENKLQSINLGNGIVSIGSYAFGTSTHGSFRNGIVYGPSSGYVKSTYDLNSLSQFDKYVFPNYINK
ncbi:MAG: leucine-rich repeat protein [Candidatus Gracilibacteria bacterium]